MDHMSQQTYCMAAAIAHIYGEATSAVAMSRPPLTASPSCQGSCLSLALSRVTSADPDFCSKEPSPATSRVRRWLWVADRCAYADLRLSRFENVCDTLYRVS